MRWLVWGLVLLVGSMFHGESDPGGESSKAQVQWRRIEPTVLLTAESPVRQAVWLQVENPGPPFEATVRVVSEGRMIAQAKLGRAPKGITEFEVFLPPPETPVDTQWLLLDAEGRVRAEDRMRWAPPRRWKLYVLKSAHIDIGLHSEPYFQRDLTVRLTEEAMRLCDQTADWPEASRFRYTLEHM